MKALKAYLDRKNAYGTIFGAKALTLDSAVDRQKIADSWPASIDDSSAREDWNWKHEFDLEMITVEMLENLKKH